MKLKLTIEMDNAAFADDGNEGRTEAARILREAADNLDSVGKARLHLRDLNGNTVDLKITGS